MDGDERSPAENRTMKDVSHTSPTGGTVTNVWQRGQTPEAVEDGRASD
jgi:hypothetical protein